MDREIDVADKRKQWAKRLITPLGVIVLLASALMWLPGWVRPSLDRQQIRTARVEWGQVQSTITASGTVVPEFEQVIASPIDSRVMAIRQRPGALLTVGQPIVELDLSASELVVERLTEEIALKQNQQAQLRQGLDRELNDLVTRREIKVLEWENLQARAEQNRQLFDMGATSKNSLRESELSEERAELELHKLDKDVANIRERTQTQMEGLALEMLILDKERGDAQRRLDRARIRADRDGVLTWVVPREGATVRQGEVVARIADLNAFRIDATVSDVHAGELHPGLAVSVRIDEGEHLMGTITRVLPAIEDGIVKFEANLEGADDARLRANLRVDVHIITARKDHTLRIRKGPFVSGDEGDRDVFVIRNDMATKTTASIGISSYEHFEVEGGLLEGDEIIISSMKEFIHMDHIQIR
ncbi:MAG: HlyD family efflux transporter periplasmic adaptor subunit [Gemmatimonadetes bacterium]|nr:HlyD family efflux transporter periplasmic adaptor subunit [Gemmatimonadota bacterium]MBT5145687.1 HlyD family efflux transporter periplasmic adaptor subunit [Gemmatimonadota bacterium]MBT5588083.1 HlyD family efflux transporter periplasmic adaptor subunit [Gemmatimonadota bacterium]MBT5960751.1 HlyD family efflux transporter periplasmic adaptor subunit [Gemmatimonadota bacterium]MBT6626975.1 HlyD family efflux transporter periplasmic adaptor subunit [Gemmatimonadota bacterium]